MNNLCLFPTSNQVYKSVLPEDMIKKIIASVPNAQISDLNIISLVSPLWNRIAIDNDIWRPVLNNSCSAKEFRGLQNAINLKEAYALTNYFKVSMNKLINKLILAASTPTKLTPTCHGINNFHRDHNPFNEPPPNCIVL